MIVTYRYRLLPTKAQHRSLAQILESQRQLYNAALEERIGAYRKANLTLTYIDQTKGLTEWRRSDPEASWLPVSLQRATLKRLAEAYGGYFRSLKAARRAERRLRVAQRALDRKKRGSGGRSKARTVVARCHAAVTRRRTEHLHQASARLVRDYDAIAIEKLNVKGLAASALAKDVHDASWTRFTSMLRYKAEWAGARLLEVDPRNTSQDCSGCGVRVPKDLGDRTHSCPHCGLSIDRDLNAARNILNRAGVGPGLRNVAGYGMRAGENLGLAPWPRRGAVVPT